MVVAGLLLILVAATLLVLGRIGHRPGQRAGRATDTVFPADAYRA